MAWPGPIHYTVSTSFTIYGGRGATVWNVNGISAYFTAETLFTGTGSDTVNVLVGDYYGEGLTVHGQGKKDVLTVDDQTITDTTTYAVTSTSVTRTTLTAVQNFIPVVFTLNYDGLASLAVSGGSGTNTLDYSGYVGPVVVDLPLGSATGFAGGISNIENVDGGIGNDILVGNGGNVLTGGTGYNLLIAGPRKANSWAARARTSWSAARPISTRTSPRLTPSWPNGPRPASRIPSGSTTC